MAYDFDSIRRQLKFDTDKHRRLSEAIMQRIRMSRDKFADRYADFADNEKQFSAYVPAKDVDTARKQNKKISGEHDYVTIEVPYSYAVVMTIHTYISSVFLSRNPVYQVQGRHGESELQIQGLEALLDYQRVAGKHTVPLFIWLFDPLKYGYGVIGQYWDEEEVQVRKFREETDTFLGIPIPGRKAKKVPYIERVKGYQGSKLFNVRPQDFFPDPRIPLSRFNEGEFCARYIEIPWMTLAENEMDGRYFNTQQARRTQRSEGSIARDLGATEINSIPEDDVQEYWSDRPDSVFKGYEFQWFLSPKAWGLGEESRHEMWIFTVNKLGTIIEARPAGVYYRGFSYDVIMYEPDGYNLFPLSALERIKPLNDVLSWLVNTHFYNIRAALNNQFIVDPTMVVMKDLTTRQPGQIIRLKPEAFGRDVRTAITQLPVTDITRTHLADAQLIELMIQRVLGATDNIMGMVNSAGRKTATEVRSSTSFGVNRIKTLCELASANGFDPFMSKMIQTTQQFYEGSDLKYKVVGDLALLAPQSIEITPEAIAGFYDFVPVDGTLPVDRYAQAQLWQLLLGQIRNFPQIMAQYDIGRIFAWVASISGLKNVQQFRVQAQDPAALAAQVQAGNMVPVSDALGDLTRVPDGGRAPDMGATG